MKHKNFTLGGFCPGGFCLGGFLSGVYVRGIFVLEPDLIQVYAPQNIRKIYFLHKILKGNSGRKIS